MKTIDHMINRPGCSERVDEWFSQVSEGILPF